MNLRTLLQFALLSTLVACGSDAGAASALSGHWSQETGTEKKGMTLEFDAQSDKLIVHTAPDADGGHDHLDGTYTLDAKTGNVTVRCKLVGEGKGDVWQGKLDGDRLSLSAGETSLEFRKGEDPHAPK
jgi:hypothetical protein